MKINLLNRLLTVAMVAMLMLGLVSVALAQDPYPQSVTWRSQVTLYNGVGVAVPVTGTAVTKPADFGVQDCYQTVDVTSLQTVTGKLQHSPDGSNWVDQYTFSAASVDTTTFTRTTVYGSYERYWASLGTTNPVTISLTCIVKDN